MTSLVLALILAVVSGSVVATPPPSLSFSVTVRDFMPQPCRTGLPAPDVTAVTNRWCPNSASIKNQVLISGTLSGHPDFQRVPTVSPTPVPGDYTAGMLLYTPVNGITCSYNGTYATFGRKFPLTYDPSNTCSNGDSYPFVLSNLTYDTTGIPKMQYCKGTEGYTCDNSRSSKSVMNETSFSTWYKDSSFYNIRSGYKQLLIYNSVTKQYEFDTAKHIANKFYDPIQNASLPGWPLSQEEVNHQAGKKFWFTTEIHNSFLYKGNEVFYFSGDDDVHVFINGRLALNLGGLHGPLGTTLNVSKYADELDLKPGKIYQFDLFHAERQVTESNYAIATTLSEACNVITSDLKSSGNDVVASIDWTASGKTNNSDFAVISGPGFGYFENKKIVLMKGGIPNVVSYMFHKQQQNVGSGFSMSFKFNMTGSGHGFSVLFHDRDLGLNDFNGGTGPNLGIKNADNSFAIVFDMCPNFPAACSGSSQLRVHYKLGGDRLNNVGIATRTVYDPSILQDWRDGSAHTVEILYYALPDWLEVYVDNSLRLVERNFSMIDVIGGKDASVGFSSSSSDASTMDVRIYDVTMKTVKVTPRFTLSAEDTNDFPKSFVANGRDTVSFKLQTRDACQNEVEFGGHSNIVQGRLVATSVSADPPSSGRRLDTANLTLLPQVIDLEDGTYAIQFKTDFLASFDAYMAFGSNCSWNGTEFVSNSECFAIKWANAAASIPFSTGAPTIETAAEGLGGAALAGIGVAAGVVAVCGSIMLFVGVRIRNQWRRDKRFVDEGRRIVAERGVDYMGDNELDVLQNRLQATLHALQAERAKRAKPEDKQDVIDELLRQKGELQEVVRRLKIKQNGGDPNAPNEPMTVGGRVRKSFAAGRISARISRGASLFNPVHNEASAPNPLFTRLRQSISIKPRGTSEAVVPEEKGVHDV